MYELSVQDGPPSRTLTRYRCTEPGFPRTAHRYRVNVRTPARTAREQGPEVFHDGEAISRTPARQPLGVDADPAKAPCNSCWNSAVGRVPQRARAPRPRAGDRGAARPHPGAETEKEPRPAGGRAKRGQGKTVKRLQALGRFPLERSPPSRLTGRTVQRNPLSRRAGRTAQRNTLSHRTE